MPADSLAVSANINSSVTKIQIFILIIFMTLDGSYIRRKTVPIVFGNICERSCYSIIYRYMHHQCGGGGRDYDLSLSVALTVQFVL